MKEDDAEDDEEARTTFKGAFKGAMLIYMDCSKFELLLQGKVGCENELNGEKSGNGGGGQFKKKKGKKRREQKRWNKKKLPKPQTTRFSLKKGMSFR